MDTINKFGLLWAREKEKDDFNKTLESGIRYFEEKYKKPVTYAECSLMDKPEPFLYEFENRKIEIKPFQKWVVGTMWFLCDEKIGNKIDDNNNIIIKKGDINNV